MKSSLTASAAAAALTIALSAPAWADCASEIQALRAAHPDTTSADASAGGTGTASTDTAAAGATTDTGAATGTDTAWATAALVALVAAMWFARPGGHV